MIHPPPLGGLGQRLGAGVDPVVAAALAQRPDLAVAGVRPTPRGERLTALLAGGVAPEDLVRDTALRALAGVDAHTPTPG